MLERQMPPMCWAFSQRSLGAKVMVMQGLFQKDTGNGDTKDATHMGLGRPKENLVRTRTKTRGLLMWMLLEIKMGSVGRTG